MIAIRQCLTFKEDGEESLGTNLFHRQMENPARRWNDPGLKRFGKKARMANPAAVPERHGRPEYEMDRNGRRERSDRFRFQGVQWSSEISSYWKSVSKRSNCTLSATATRSHVDHYGCFYTFKSRHRLVTDYLSAGSSWSDSGVTAPKGFSGCSSLDAIPSTTRVPLFEGFYLAPSEATRSCPAVDQCPVC